MVPGQRRVACWTLPCAAKRGRSVTNLTRVARVKQVVAAIAVLAILIAVLIVVLTGGDETAVTEVPSVEAADGTGVADAVAAAEEAVDDATGAVAAVAEDAADEAAVAAAETAATLSGASASADAMAEDLAAGVATAQQPGEGRPSFDVVRVETSGEAVMAGRATPGASVTIMTRDGVLAQTTADERGEWVVVLDAPLAPGSHEIWLEATAADGRSSESREAVVMTVPGGDGDAVAAEASGGTGDSGGGVLAVTVPRDGGGDVAVLQAPASGIGISGGGALTLDSLSYDDKGAVTLSGKADPGAEIRPYVDGTLAGRATADAEGNWSLTLETPLDAGRHDLRVDQVDAEGQVAQRLETPIQQAAFTMPSSSEPVIVIQPGNNLWVIARHIYGRGVLYTQIFEANREQIVDPDLIFPGQIFVLPDTGQAGG